MLQHLAAMPARAKYGHIMSAGNGAGDAENDAAQDSKLARAAILGAGTTHDCRDTPGMHLTFMRDVDVICTTVKAWCHQTIAWRHATVCTFTAEVPNWLKPSLF